MYTEKVMKQFTNPTHTGVIEDADGVGEVGNPVCGDMMTFYIKVRDDRLEEVKFNTFGCVAAIAVSNMVSEMATGKTLDEVKKTITKQNVAKALGGLPKEKMHCSNLGADALALAIKDYEEKRQGKTPASRLEPKRPEKPAPCGCCGAENPPEAKFCMECGEKRGR